MTWIMLNVCFICIQACTAYVVYSKGELLEHYLILICGFFLLGVFEYRFFPIYIKIEDIQWHEQWFIIYTMPVCIYFFKMPCIRLLESQGIYIDLPVDSCWAPPFCTISCESPVYNESPTIVVFLVVCVVHELCIFVSFLTTYE